MRFCFHLAETLGVVDPRTIYHNTDSELIALWMAHFSLKSEATGSRSGQRDYSDIALNDDDIDRQVQNCERLMM